MYKDNQLITKIEVKAGVDASRYWMYKEGLKQGVPCIFLSPSEIIEKVPEAIYYHINEDWVRAREMFFQFFRVVTPVY